MDGQSKYLLIKENPLKITCPEKLCSLAKVKKLCTTPYHPETNGQCECFNATLISMLGTLPSHAKKN